MIEILPYDPQWALKFAREADFLKQALEDNCIDIHHIGSTAVPGLWAKPKIDILLVVRDYRWVWEPLESLGYEGRGELNIPLRWYFRKETTELSANVHVCEKDNPDVDLFLLFRDYLRTHADAREDYTALKHYLIAQEYMHERESGSMPKYTFAKEPFIQKILKKAGWNHFTGRFCVHYTEWEAYHRIHALQRLSPPDLQGPLSASNCFYLVFYKGVDIVAAASVRELPELGSVLQSLAIDPIYAGKGYGTQFLKFLEKWVLYRAQEVLKVYAPLSHEEFFRKRGYVDANPEDPETYDEEGPPENTVSLEKWI